MKTLPVWLPLCLTTVIAVAQTHRLGDKTPPTVVEPTAEYLALHDEARRLYSEGKLTEAEQRVRVVLAKYPHHAPSNQLLALILRARASDPSAPLRRKLDSILIPRVNFKDALVESALDFLRDETRRLDPAQRGVSFVVNLPEHIRQRRVTLDLIDIPAADLLEYLAELGGFRYRVERSAVVVFATETARPPAAAPVPSEPIQPTIPSAP